VKHFYVLLAVVTFAVAVFGPLLHRHLYSPPHPATPAQPAATYAFGE
jgi:hypothetical protein